jgi:hypothetical protein
MILDCLLYNDCSNLNDVLITPQRYSMSCEKKCACICVLKPNRTLFAFWHNLQSPLPSPFVDIPFICPASIRTSHMMRGFNHIELNHEQTVLLMKHRKIIHACRDNSCSRTDRMLHSSWEVSEFSSGQHKFTNQYLNICKLLLWI